MKTIRLGILFTTLGLGVVVGACSSNIDEAGSGGFGTGATTTTTSTTTTTTTSTADLDQDGDGFTPHDGDCNDLQPSIFPGAAEICDDVVDNNCNGATDASEPDGDGDGFGPCAGDCDDTNPQVSPAATELPGDNVDNNCDGVVDADFDSDGFTVAQGDGDDTEYDIHPGAAETCFDGVDNDCNGFIDAAEPDGDGDSYGPCGGDCDDSNPNVHPGAPEVGGNNLDDNCDFLVDEDVDADGWTVTNGDCDDADASVNPSILEVCSDGIDNDCDGTVDTDCLTPCELAALTRSNVGCDYYPTVTANSLLLHIAAPGDPNGFHFAVAISNTSNQAATYTITRGAAAVTNGTVAANSVQIVQLPWAPELRASGATIMSLASANNGAYHLVTDRPVTVYQYNPLEYAAGGYSSYTNDASLLFPTNAWTGDYRVAARNTWSGYSGFYAVIASQDATQVTVTPSPTGGSVMAGAGIAANGTGTVTMNRGDVLQVFSSTAGTPDLTGTHVVANKPVAVIGGHNCTNVPASIPYCDHIEESDPPVETLSKSYVVVSPWIANNTQKAELVRVIATADNTTWTYDPPQAGWPTSLATAGSYVELPQSAVSVAITANNKILVAAYLLGQDAGGASGDPAMTIAVAREQYRDTYLFHAPTNYNTNFVDIIAPTGQTVLLDGVALPLGSFAAVGGTGLSAGHFPLSNAGNGNHNVTSSVNVGINVYGYGQYTSYWYPGGLDLAAIPNN